MQGIKHWNHTPYAPLNAPQLSRELYICQLRPFANGFSAAFRDSMSCGHTLLYRLRSEKDWEEMPAEGSPVWTPSMH